MKKFLFLLIFGISIANVTFTSCSDDDNYKREITEEDRRALIAEYDELVEKINLLKEELSKDEKAFETATGSYWTILRDRIATNKKEIDRLEAHKKGIERKLGL